MGPGACSFRIGSTVSLSSETLELDEQQERRSRPLLVDETGCLRPADGVRGRQHRARHQVRELISVATAWESTLDVPRTSTTTVGGVRGRPAPLRATASGAARADEAVAQQQRSDPDEAGQERGDEDCKGGLRL